MTDDLKQLIDDMSPEEKLLVLSFFSANREEFLFAASEAKARYERADGYRADPRDDLRHRCADMLLAKDAESWGYGVFEGDRDSALAIADVVLAAQGEELETLRRANEIQRGQIRAYVSAHQEDTAKWSSDLEAARAALAEATAKLDRLTTRGQIAGEEIELANRRLRLIQREMNEQSERTEKAEAVLAEQREVIEDQRRVNGEAISRAEKAEDAISRVRHLADDWATLPGGTYARAGKQVLAALDSPDVAL